MRHILTEYARRRLSEKRGGQVEHVPFDETLNSIRIRGVDFIALDEVLNTLAELDPRKARVVELRFFAGLSVQETAELLQVSEDTVLRDWKFAKHWLWCELGAGQRDGQ